MSRDIPHLVIDIRALSPHRDGISTYILGVVPRLVQLGSEWRTTLIANASMAETVQGWDATIVIDDSRPMWPRQNVTIPRLVRSLSADVFFYPAHDPPFGRISCPLVITIHDLTPFVIRPYFEKFDRLKRGYLRVVTSRGIRRAVRINADSSATFDSIKRFFGDDAAAKTEVIHIGHDVPRSRSTVVEAHLLYLGTDRPHKNLGRLIEAYAAACHDHPGLPPLILAGGFRNEDAVARQVSEAGIGARTTITGHVSDETAESLLVDAMALAMPSLAEGFGMPVLEAMAREVPVITSDRSSCKEVAGDATLLVDPYDSASIAAAIVRMCTDDQLRVELARKGLAQAEQFSWEKAASRTFESIRTVIERGP